MQVDCKSSEEKEIKILQKGMNIDDDIIREKIKDSGYIVSSIERILMDKEKIIINTNSCSFCEQQYLSMLCYTCTSSSNWCNSGALISLFSNIPFLITISENKEILFIISGLL